ncbi:MAG: hypothetical protein JNL89_18380 [Rhodanobacteraceae bacterium]|nr:hypothetical protein [Rhodanobacteraceae bacterium]
MRPWLPILLLASTLSLPSHARAEAFVYRPDRAPAPGTVWHYTKSNIDGSDPWHLDVYFASPTRIDVVKWAEGGSDFVEVAADFDPARAMPVNLQQWNTTAEGRAPRLWANAEADKLTVQLAGGPRFELAAHGRPLHLWGFDLMGLAFMLPHLADPTRAFELQVVDPNRPGEGEQPFAQGVARFELAGVETIDGVTARRYRISGAVFGDAAGWLWVDQASGRLLRSQHPVPTSTDWNDWKLSSTGEETMDGNQWESFKLNLARALRKWA